MNVTEEELLATIKRVFEEKLQERGHTVTAEVLVTVRCPDDEALQQSPELEIKCTRADGRNYGATCGGRVTRRRTAEDLATVSATLVADFYDRFDKYGPSMDPPDPQEN